LPAGITVAQPRPRQDFPKGGVKRHMSFTPSGLCAARDTARYCGRALEGLSTELAPEEEK
jgi:hypothetical protein